MKPNASAAAVLVILLLAGAVFFLRARNPDGFNKLVDDVTSLFSSSPTPTPASTTPSQSLPAKIAHPATAAIEKANQQAYAVINETSPTKPAATASRSPSPATTAVPPPSPAPLSPTAVGGIASQASSDTVNVTAPPVAPGPATPAPALNSDGSVVAGPAGTPDANAPAVTQWKPPVKMPAQRNWTWTTTDGHTYTNVKVLKVEPDHVTILHSTGGAQVQLSTLPPDLQKLFNYDPDAAAQWALPSLLEGNLVVLKDKTLQDVSDDFLPPIKYYALFYGASWCAPCEAFTPTFVKFYQNFKPSHPDFEVIFISEDTDAAAMLKHFQTDSMPWPAFRFDQLVHPPGQFKGPGIEAYANKGIPDLVLVDSTGRVLSDTYHGNAYLGPETVIDDIKKIVQ